MTSKSVVMTDVLRQYALSVSLREADVLAKLRHETQKLEMARMQIAPEQGQFMALLAQALGVRRALEIGVFTGYSALSVALALPENGVLIACDINAEWTGIAQRYWYEAGVQHKIDLRLAPAIDTLDTLLADHQQGSFDFAFIDADKTNYILYYERVLQLLRKGGVLLVDNVLWSGAVVDNNDQSEDTQAIRAFNLHVYEDPRVKLSLLPLADGVTMVVKV